MTCGSKATEPSGSYVEVADRLGITPEAARSRAKRLGWRRQLGNDGRAIVLAALEPRPPGDAPVTARAQGGRPGGRDRPRQARTYNFWARSNLVETINGTAGCTLKRSTQARHSLKVANDRKPPRSPGIHLGDVVEEADGDLMGDGVNIAARLEGIAKPGAICLSEDAYRQVKGRLDLAVSDLGPTQLKNIAEPIRVYALDGWHRRDDAGDERCRAQPQPRPDLAAALDSTHVRRKRDELPSAAALS